MKLLEAINESPDKAATRDGGKSVLRPMCADPRDSHWVVGHPGGSTWHRVTTVKAIELSSNDDWEPYTFKKAKLEPNTIDSALRCLEEYGREHNVSLVTAATDVVLKGVEDLRREILQLTAERDKLNRKKAIPADVLAQFADATERAQDASRRFDRAKDEADKRMAAFSSAFAAVSNALDEQNREGQYAKHALSILIESLTRIKNSLGAP